MGTLACVYGAIKSNIFQWTLYCLVQVLLHFLKPRCMCIEGKDFKITMVVWFYRKKLKQSWFLSRENGVKYFHILIIYYLKFQFNGMSRIYTVFVFHRRPYISMVMVPMHLIKRGLTYINCCPNLKNSKKKLIKKLKKKVFLILTLQNTVLITLLIVEFLHILWLNILSHF